MGKSNNNEIISKEFNEKEIKDEIIEEHAIRYFGGKRFSREKKRQKYRRLCADLNDAKRRIDMAQTPNEATLALDDLALLIVSAREIDDFEEVFQLLDETDELLKSIRNYFKTRHELELMLQLLLKRLSDLIDLERQNECGIILQRLFQEMAKNSTEVVKVIKMDQLID